MGSHYAALIIEDDLRGNADTVLSLVEGKERSGGRRPVGTVIGVQPLDPEQLAIAFHPGWTLAYGRPLLLDRDEDIFHALAVLSDGTKALYWGVEDTSGFLGFACFKDGKKVRSWFEAEGTVYENTGDALAGEPAGFFTHEPDEAADEWEVIEVIEKESLSWDAINALRFSVYHVRR